MLMVQSGLDVVNSSIRHPTPFHHALPFRGRLSARFGFDESFKDGSMFHAGAIGSEPRVDGPFRFAEAVAKQAEQAVITTTEEDIAVLRAEAGIGDDGGWSRC